MTANGLNAKFKFRLYSSIFTIVYVVGCVPGLLFYIRKLPAANPIERFPMVIFAREKKNVRPQTHAALH